MVFSKNFQFLSVFISKKKFVFTFSYMLFIRLMIIFGLTWFFEGISFLEPEHVIFLVFDILNTLQGLIIFLLFVMKARVRKLIRKKCVSFVVNQHCFSGIRSMIFICSLKLFIQLQTFSRLRWQNWSGAIQDVTSSVMFTSDSVTSNTNNNYRMTYLARKTSLTQSKWTFDDLCHRTNTFFIIYNFLGNQVWIYISFKTEIIKIKSRTWAEKFHGKTIY